MDKQLIRFTTTCLCQSLIDDHIEAFFSVGRLTEKKRKKEKSSLSCHSKNADMKEASSTTFTTFTFSFIGRSKFQENTTIQSI